MKLYLKDGNVLGVNENVKLELLNLNGFLSIMKANSKNVPAGHFKANLKYKLIDGTNEYMGEAIFDSYHGISNSLDEASSYKVELVNWHLADEQDNYIEFNVVAK